MRKTMNCVLVGAVVLFSGKLQASSQDTDQLVRVVQAVSREGAGHQEAQGAWRQLAQGKADSLLPVLRGINTANPLAANWLLSAFETIADRALKSGQQLPQRDLEKFVTDVTNSARARRIAFEWLAKADPTAPDRLIPGMLHDPGAEFRRDAVARLTDAARRSLEQKRSDEATGMYQKALTGATDDDQVKAIVEALKKLGCEVHLQQHFGFLVNWHVIGPFDNKNQKGFPVEYPPEAGVDLKATYEGVNGRVTWSTITTQDDYGVVDIAKSIAPLKGVVLYLTTEFASDRERKVEFRVGTPNAFKIWLDGQLIYAREEYHRGMLLDQYKIPVALARGKSRILVKLCQNEQTEAWAQKYELQFRVCDESGKAVLPVSP